MSIESFEIDGNNYEVVKPFYQFLQWLLNERQLFDQGYIQTCVTKNAILSRLISNQNMSDTANLSVVKDNVRLNLKGIIESMSDLSHFTERNREAIISASRMADEINSPETRRLSISRLQGFSKNM